MALPFSVLAVFRPKLIKCLFPALCAWETGVFYTGNHRENGAGPGSLVASPIGTAPAQERFPAVYYTVTDILSLQYTDSVENCFRIQICLR